MNEGVWEPDEDLEWQEAKKIIGQIGEEDQKTYKGVYKDLTPLPINYADKCKDKWHQENRIKKENRRTK